MRHTHNPTCGHIHSMPVLSFRGTTPHPSNVPECDTVISYSTLNRSTAMVRNVKDAVEFITQQENVLLSMVVSLEAFAVMLNRGDSKISLHSGYLLSSRSVSNSLSAKFRGKPLFDTMRDKPLRMHIEVNGILQAFDFPNPQLSSLPELQGFMLGTQISSLPTKELTYECISSLMGCLLRVRQEKDKLNAWLLDFKFKPNPVCGSTPKAKKVTHARLSISNAELWSIVTTKWHAFLTTLGMKTI